MAIPEHELLLPSLVDGMPIASALLSNDTDSLAKIIRSFLPNSSSAQVTDVIIKKSLGEAFTGGRSTPVYEVSCQVYRQPPGQCRQRHFVAKLILMPSNIDDGKIEADEESVNHRLWVKRESYRVERQFYDCAAPRLGAQQFMGIPALPVPKLLASDRDGSRPWSAVCFFMNDLRHGGFPCHPDFLSPEQTKRALRWLASFHARFWGEVKVTSSSSSWRRHLWERGGFWTVKRRNGDLNSSQRVKVVGMAQQWTQTIRFLESKHPAVITSHTKALGKRLEAAARPIAEFLTRQSQSANGTLIHGDFKAANMFLSITGDDDDDDIHGGGDISSVAVLDFQFAGLGLAAEDVAYFLFPDARGHYFDREPKLLKVYYDEFISQLILQQKGGPSTLSIEAFRGYYELSRIDFIRYWLEKGWVASTDGDAKLVTALEATMFKLDGGRERSEMEYAQAAAKLTNAKG